jgi:hypothetical protein
MTVKQQEPPAPMPVRIAQDIKDQVSEGISIQAGRSWK